MVRLEQAPGAASVFYVAQNMRVKDREEIYATYFQADPEELTRRVMSTGAFSWAVTQDGKPVAAFGAAPRWPNVWSVWAFGTDDWPKVVMAITRHIKNYMIPTLIAAGATRVDCPVLATNTSSRKWLEYLGASPEIVLDNWGKNGEKFVLYSWTRKQTLKD